MTAIVAGLAGLLVVLIGGLTLGLAYYGLLALGVAVARGLRP